MKKIVNFRCYVSVNGEDYCDTSFRTRIRYYDTTGESETIINDWEEAYKAISEHRVLNAEIGTTLLTNRPIIIIHYGDFRRADRKISEKKFRSLKFKWVSDESDNVYTTKELADLLPAEQFCEWLKDQGIAINIGG